MFGLNIVLMVLQDEGKRYVGNQEMEEDGGVEECDKTYKRMRSDSS